MKTQNNKSNIKMNTNIEMRPCLSPELEKEGWRVVELEKDGRGNTLLRIPSDLVGKDCFTRHCYISEWTNHAWASQSMEVCGCFGRRVVNLSYAEGGGSHLARFAIIRRNYDQDNAEAIGRELAKLENFKYLKL